MINTPDCGTGRPVPRRSSPGMATSPASNRRAASAGIAALAILLAVTAGGTAAGERMAVWVHSDIQPEDVSERRHFETALLDVKNNLPGTFIAVAAGDMVHQSSRADTWEWLLKVRGSAGIPHWYEIAGNHEARNFQAYSSYVRKPLYYSVTVGNLVMLMMSDEDRGPDTGISPLTFEWWKDRVVRNRDRIIVTVTHAALDGSGHPGTLFPSMVIRDSRRFEDVLKKYRVDLWLSGHTHQPYYLWGKNRVVRGMNGTLFVNVASIRRDFIFDPIESRMLYFETGSPFVLVRTRDHGKKKFVKGADIRHRLGRPFLWDGSPPLLGQ